MNRELQKHKLKQGVIRSEKEEPRHSFRRIPRRALLIGAGFLAALILFASVYAANRHSTDYSLLWEKDMDTVTSGAESFKGYATFAKGMIRYSKDGAAYITQDGKTIWERSYQINEPIASVNENYAVIADRGGTNLYIFNDGGNTGVATTILPITEVEVSAGGVVYAVLRDDKADWITSFKPDGSAIDLSVKSIITGDGYPLDTAVSPDGTELVTSYVAVKDGSMSNQVIFRNFGEVGKNADARRIVGGFSEEFTDHLVSRVHFSSNTEAQAFYDGGIVFFSTKVLTSPEVKATVAFEDEVASIACGEDYVAVILNVNDPEKPGPYRMDIYRTDGSKAGETTFDFAYSDFEIQGNAVLLTGEHAVHIYKPSGKERASLDFGEQQISKVIKAKLPGEYLVSSGGKLLKIKLQ